MDISEEEYFKKYMYGAIHRKYDATPSYVHDLDDKPSFWWLVGQLYSVSKENIISMFSGFTCGRLVNEQTDSDTLTPVMWMQSHISQPSHMKNANNVDVEAKEDESMKFRKQLISEAHTAVKEKDRTLHDDGEDIYDEYDDEEKLKDDLMSALMEYDVDEVQKDRQPKFVKFEGDYDENDKHDKHANDEKLKDYLTGMVMEGVEK